MGVEKSIKLGIRWKNETINADLSKKHLKDDNDFLDLILGRKEFHI